MSILLETFQYLSNAERRDVPVSVYRDLSEAQLDCIETEWVPRLLEQKKIADTEYTTLPETERTLERYRELLGQYGAPDCLWNWRHLVWGLNSTQQLSLAIATETRTEAASILTRKEAESRSSGLMYVDYLAVAPWNRREFQAPDFSGLGRTMIGLAVSESLECGFDGRCGLHALPSAARFYHKLGMTAFGPDHAHEDLDYFEFSPEAAKRFLEV